LRALKQRDLLALLDRSASDEERDRRAFGVFEPGREVDHYLGHVETVRRVRRYGFAQISQSTGRRPNG